MKEDVLKNVANGSLVVRNNNASSVPRSLLLFRNPLIYNGFFGAKFNPYEYLRQT